MKARKEGREWLMTRIPARLFRDGAAKGALFTVRKHKRVCGCWVGWPCASYNPITPSATDRLGFPIPSYLTRSQIFKTAYAHKELLQWRSFNFEAKVRTALILDRMYMCVYICWRGVCLFEAEVCIDSR